MCVLALGVIPPLDSGDSRRIFQHRVIRGVAFPPPNTKVPVFVVDLKEGTAVGALSRKRVYPPLNNSQGENAPSGWNFSRTCGVRKTKAYCPMAFWDL